MKVNGKFKQILVTGLVNLAVVLVGFFLFWAKGVSAEEVTDFSIDIVINKDSSITVEEVIAYDFGEIFRHGIYRDIPVNYKDGFGNKVALEIKVREVTDLNSNEYQYEVSKVGKNLHLKIGDEDKTINGRHIYRILYDVVGAINFFDQHSELYWNVTGNEWSVPIGYVQSKVALSQGKFDENSLIACYKGVLGAKESECVKQIVDGEAQFFAQNLIRGEGLTVVVSIPAGLIDRPSFWVRAGWFLKANWIVFLPLLVLIVFYVLWRKYGQDEKGKGVIVPQYEPPRKLTPGEIGVLVDERVDKHETAATIIDLARRGYFKIREVNARDLTPTWEFLKLKEGGSLLETNQHEWEIYNGLFAGNKDRVELSDLQNEFYKSVRKYKKALYQKVVSKKFFFQNPEKTRCYYCGSSLVVIAILLVMSLAFDFFSLTALISLVTSAIIACVFGMRMPKKTRLGKLIEEEISGFKLFLSVTEKDRVKFHFSPEKNPEKFALYVPYAIALGVEREWADVFAGVAVGQLEWYEGSRSLDAVALVATLNSFSQGLNNVFVPPSTAASGGSGFSGGVSGGGFGGGGGGSW